METTIDELEFIINSFGKKIGELDEVVMTSRPAPEKWSKKEVLGHLIDSAHNNLRRLICAQYETSPPKIVYDQDFWVIANGYHRRPSVDIVQLWVLINRQLLEVLRNMPGIKHSCECDTGKYQVQLHSLAWLADDYVKHLKHHLNQIIPSSFNIVYP